MASKGPKTGGTAPAAPKSASRPRKTSAAKPKVAAAETEKPAPQPAAKAAQPASPRAEQPAAAPEAVPQERIEKAVEKTAGAPAAAAAAEIATETAAVAQAAPDVAKKEATRMETNVNNAQALFADMNDRTKAAVEKSTKMVEEMNDFAKGNVEALVESGRITAKGLESFGQEAAEYSRKSFENATAALKQMATVKSPTDFFKLQSDFLRSSFDSYVAEASKNTEAMLKLAGDAAQPLSNRFAVAAEKVKTAA